MPIVMIEFVRRNICIIQSGVKVHELQVLRGYDMSGATIHDVHVRWACLMVEGFEAILEVEGFSMV